jgi:hypothetical protein
MRDAWRRFAANRPAAIGAAVISAFIITGLSFITAGGIAGSRSAAGNGAVWLFIAAVLGCPFAYGYWCGRRPRKIRAEEQLDMVTATALEVRDMLRGHQQPSAPAKLELHIGGKA